MSTLTPLEQFQRDGFYFARGLLTKEEVVAVRDGLHRSFKDQLSQLGVSDHGADIFASMRALHGKDVLRYRRLAGALWRKIEVFNLMHSSKIQRVLTEDFGWGGVFVPGGQVVH